MPLRIFVADDHEVTRAVISALLTAHPGWEVCGEAADGRDAVLKIEELKPDIAVLDIAMPNQSGLDAAREIVQSRASQKIVIVTPTETDAVVRNIFEAGARGFVVKARATQDLTYAIEALQRGRTFFGARFADLILRERLGNSEDGTSNRAALSAMSEREREDLQRLAKELANPFQSPNRRGDMAHPLRKYAVALAALIVAAAAGWGTYTGQWDRIWPEVHRLSTKVGFKSDPPPAEEGNPETRVWVDIHTALYYCPGADSYGKTPRGRYTKQRDAQMDRFEPAGGKACE